MADYQRRSIYVGDIKSHFLEAGSGPDLVLLHGGEYGASAEITWRRNIGKAIPCHRSRHARLGQHG